MGKNSLFIKWCWDNWISTYTTMSFDPGFTSCTDYKCIKGLKVRAKTIKKKLGRKHTCKSSLIRQVFLIYDTKSTSKQRKNKLGFVEIKSYCAPMGTIKRVKIPPKEWKKIFGNHISDKNL